MKLSQLKEWLDRTPKEDTPNEGAEAKPIGMATIVEDSPLEVFPNQEDYDIPSEQPPSN